MKTAIDYIIGELLDNQTYQHDDYVTIDLSKDHLDYLINRAKEMEKEQIIESWDNGWKRANETKNKSYSTAEDYGFNYYNETFKSE